MNDTLAFLAAALLAVAPCAAQSDAAFFRDLADGAQAARTRAQDSRLFQRVDFVQPQANPALQAQQREQQALQTLAQSATMIVRVAIEGGHAAGTGVFVDPSGLALTNAHVVALSADGLVDVEIGAALLKRKARVLASAPGRDIAILQVIQEKGLKADWPALRLGDQPQAGAIVFAIGNPINQGFTFTKGDVGQSANTVMSPWVDPIQLSLQLNPGNSGGPLVDISGKLVGLNSSILRSDDEQNTGISFAIPASALSGALAEYRSTGRLVDTATSLRFGPGLIITKVKPGSEPDKAGFKVGDAIASFPGSDQVQPGQRLLALARLVGHGRVGQNIPVVVVRGVDVVLQTAEPKAAKPKAVYTVRFNPALGIAAAVPADEKAAAAWRSFIGAVTRTSEEKLLINGKLYATKASDDTDEESGFFEAVGWTPVGAAVQAAIPVEEFKREVPKKK